MNRALRDLIRLLPLLAAAVLLLWASGDLGQLFGRPELTLWSSFAALTLFGVALSHVLRRMFFPYLDLRKLAEQANEKGLVFLGVCIVLGASLMLMSGLVRAEPIPAAAAQYRTQLEAEAAHHWPGNPGVHWFAAQVEKETCITMTHRKCWNPRAELRTDRERGVGFGQITRTARFDALAEMVAVNPRALAGWSWDSERLYDPALQLRALVLMDARNWRLTTGAATELDRMHFTLAGYNGGPAGVAAERTLCRGTPGCDPGRWFGHVEHTSRKARKAANGYGQGFFQINRGYVARIDARRRAYGAAWYGV